MMICQYGDIRGRVVKEERKGGVTRKKGRVAKEDKKGGL